jgi:lipid A disaccharide synthetase
MLSKRLGNLGASQLKQSFSSSVCIMAGYQSQDLHGARIISSLREKTGDKLEFFGIGGAKMKEAGLGENLADIKQFIDKPLYTFKNSHGWHRERLYAIYMVATRYNNYKVVQELEKDLYTRLLEQKPDAVITLGNEYFMKRVYCMAEKKYAQALQSKTYKPPMIHFDKLIINQHIEHEGYLDHFFYSIPLEPINWTGYKFPSTFVGSQGLFDVYSHLYQGSSKHKNLVDKNGIYINEEYSPILFEELILQRRSEFRTANDIPETNTVIFASPGSDQVEINWAVPKIAEGVNILLKRFSKVASDNFTVVISLPEGITE